MVAEMVRKGIVLTASIAANMLFFAVTAEAENEPNSLEVRLAEKVIIITGTGTDAQYIEEGKPKQLNVVIAIGDSIKWKNPAGNRTHTATSDAVVMGARLFDERIGPGEEKSVTFDQARYDKARAAAGIAAGEIVHIGYYCAPHADKMGGKIVLGPPEKIRDLLEKSKREHTEKKE